MDHQIKIMYISLVGWNKTPEQIFKDWNKFKEMLNHEGVGCTAIYPEHVKMAVKYKTQ